MYGIKPQSSLDFILLFHHGHPVLPVVCRLICSFPELLPLESDQNVPFHVFSVCMKESATPRKKATPQHQAYANWQMPPAGAAAGMNP